MRYYGPSYTEQVHSSQMAAFSQEQGNNLAFGMLAGFFVVGTLFLLSIGFSLLQR